MTENEVIEPVEQTEEVQQAEQQEMTAEEMTAIWARAKRDAKRILAEAYAKEKERR